jgi:HlyD family secretion protein
MSSPSERSPWRPLGPRGRWVAPSAGVVLAAGAWLALAPRDPVTARPIVVQRGDLVQTVDVEGELAAVRSTEIGPPPVTEVEFKIAFLAPEGTTVKKGDPILGFDTDVLRRNLAQKKAELEEAAANVVRKDADLRLALLNLDQQTAQAEAELGKARLKADVPPDVQQRVEFEKAQLEVRGRERDLQNLKAERVATESSGRAELRSLEQQRDRARGRVAELEASIQKMTVLAPQPGIVIYRTNWRDEKKKVGDTAWMAETILSIPDLSEMEAEGFVDEADGGEVAEGQPVVLRLEARPDMDLKGRVRRIARTVRQRSWRTPGKGFKVEIALDRTDPLIMRPAMRFRGEVETGRQKGLLLLPREAVFLHDAGPVVWARGPLGWSERPVRLGRSNRTQIEVLAGVVEGDRVIPVDMRVPERPAPSRRAEGPS